MYQSQFAVDSVDASVHSEDAEADTPWCGEGSHTSQDHFACVPDQQPECWLDTSKGTRMGVQFAPLMEYLGWQS